MPSQKGETAKGPNEPSWPLLENGGGPGGPSTWYEAFHRRWIQQENCSAGQGSRWIFDLVRGIRRWPFRCNGVREAFSCVQRSQWVEFHVKLQGGFGAQAGVFVGGSSNGPERSRSVHLWRLGEALRVEGCRLSLVIAAARRAQLDRTGRVAAGASSAWETRFTRWGSTSMPAGRSPMRCDVS